MELISRITEQNVLQHLDKRMALVLTGARQVGKTTMLKKLFEDFDSLLRLNADETDTRQRLSEITLPALKSAIGEYKTVIIDEIQRIENAGLLLKVLVDNFPDRQFIATGSSALEISETVFEPLTGRHILLKLFPFTLAEMYPRKSAFEIEREIPFHLLYGCYPRVKMQPENAELLLDNLRDQYLYKDVLVWKDIRKPKLLDDLLILLAHQIGSEVSLHELSNRLQVKSETIDNYLDLLEKAFVIFRLPAFSTNQRNEVSKMTKIFFWDVGIRNAVIQNYTPLSLRNDTEALWENFIIADRMKMNAFRMKKVKSFFWRNYNQAEVDYVESASGQIRAFEMKWSSNKPHRVPQAFLNAYPKAKTDVITPRNFYDFCF